jgi:hypothetical protein
MTKRPQNQIEELKDRVDAFDKQVKEMTIDNMNTAPQQDYEPPKISQKQIENNDLHIRPTRWINDGQKFNPKFEKEWEFAKEYVQCVPIHNELRGDLIEFWTHPFGGKGAEFWQVPSDKPVWITRYAAEQLTKCKYHRLKMDETKTISQDGSGTYYGQLVAKTTIQRLDALPVNNRKSVFMGMAA